MGSIHISRKFVGYSMEPMEPTLDTSLHNLLSYRVVFCIGVISSSHLKEIKTFAFVYFKREY